MPDNFNSAYLAARQDRNKAELDKLIAQDEQYVQANPQKAPAPAPAAPAPKKEPSPSALAEGLKAVGGGVADAARNTWNLIDDAATWLDNNLLDLRIGSSSFGTVGGAKKSLSGQITGGHKEQLQIPALPEWAQNKTTAGQVARSITQFVVPFLGATKALKAAGMANTAVRGFAAGGATDMAAFDPHEKRLSNLILDLTDGQPAVAKPVFDYLAADPTDSNMEGRLKNTLEGFGVGMAAEGIIKGLKATRAHFQAKGENPAQAVKDLAAQEDLTAHAVDTSKAPDMALSDQIDLLTGVRKDGPEKWQKRLDVAAAFKGEAKAADPNALPFEKVDVPTGGKRELSLEDPNAIPFTKDAGAAPEITLGDHLKLVEDEVSSGKARSAFWDPAESSIIITREPPTPTSIPLDQRILPILDKPAHLRTAEDLIALRAYRQLQEAAFPGLAKATPDAAEGAGKQLITETSAGAGKAALSDEARAAAKEMPAKAPAPSVGETVFYGEGKGSGELVKLLKDGKAMIRDDATGSLKTVLLDPADPLMGSIKAGNQEFLKAAGRGQGGFVSPSVLANLASAQVGGIAGWNSAEDDASMAEKLSLAGLGALAGLGVKVGASKVLSKAERAVVEKPHPVASALAREGMDNIAPLTEAMAAKKPAPVIHMDKVKSIVQAAREGRLGEVADGAMKDAINFTRVDSEEAVNELYQAVQSTFQKELEKSAGGAIRTHEMVRENAELTGTGLKSLEERYQKVANLDSQVLADRQLLQASAEKARELIRMAAEQGDPFSILAAEKQLKLHAVIQAKVSATRTEVARALSAMRITANSADLALNEASALVESLGGHTAKLDYFKQLAAIPTDAGLNKAIRMGALAKTRDALTEAVVMGKLWSPVTHAANAVGNMLTAVGGLAEKATASMIGKFITKSPDAIQSGEVKSQLFGMLGGIEDALGITAQGRKALKEAAGDALTGDFKGAGQKVLDNIEEFGDSYRSAILDAPVGRSTLERTIDAGSGSTVNAISSKAFNLDSEKPIGMLVDALGTLNRLPGRALGASDELFWAINYRGELRAQAYRTARQEGHEGDTLVSRVAELLDEPTQEMRAIAVKAAQTGTFTEPLTGFGKDLQKWVDAANVGGVPIGRMVVPFVRTPYNIMKYAAERTPLVQMATDSWKADIAAGGYRRDMALARATLGSTLLMTGATLATGMTLGDTEVKLIGGGDLDQSAEKLGGELPYSLKVGNKYYTFNRLDPIGMFLGLAADFRDISSHVDDTAASGLVAASVLSLARNVSSKSYLSGLVDLVDALSKARAGNTKALERYLMDQGASLVPASTLWNTIRKEDDPMAREVWSMMDSIKSKLPGYSKDLPPVRNAFGEPVKLVGGLGSDMVSPVRTSEATTDPLASEIARLNVDLKQPSKTLPGANGSPGIDLSPQQYDKLVKHSGEFFKTELGKVIASDRYQKLPENPENNVYMEGKEKIIRDLHTRAKLYGTRKLLSEDTDLRTRFYADKRNALNALTGGPVVPF